MAETYPSSVPSLVEIGSISSAPINSVLGFKVDIGKSMSRNRFTGELFFTSWRIQMTKTELDILMDWYHNTLNKVLTFDFPEPLVGVNREYSFISPPESIHLGREHFLVTYKLKSIVGYNIISPVSPTSAEWATGDSLEWDIADDLEWT